MNSTRQLQFSDALLWGCFKHHVTQLREGSLKTGQKVYHFTMAALELLPGLSQVISIIEVIAHKIFSTKEAPPSKLPPTPPSTQPIELPPNIIPESRMWPEDVWFTALLERAALQYRTQYTGDLTLPVMRNRNSSSRACRAYKYRTEGQTLTVYRPNHGLTHGGRIAVLTEVLVRTILKDSRFGKLHEWAKKKLTTEGVDFVRPVLAVGAFHRAGRTSEASDTKGMMPGWKRIFQEEAEHFNFGKDITDSCIETFGFHAKAMDSNKYSGEDAEYISRITNIAHFSDHRRIPGWNVEASHIAQALHLAKCDVEWGFALKAVGVLWELSKKLLKATGATVAPDLKRVGKDTKGNIDLFAKLENDPKRLARVLEPFRRRTLDIPATGGAGSGP